MLFPWHIENISSQFAKQVKALTRDSYICKFIIVFCFAGNLFHNILVQQLICSKYLENKNTFLVCFNFKLVEVKACAVNVRLMYCIDGLMCRHFLYGVNWLHVENLIPFLSARLNPKIPNLHTGQTKSTKKNDAFGLFLSPNLLSTLRPYCKRSNDQSNKNDVGSFKFPIFITRT